MPASSIGALNAWGVYLIASAALVAALVPQLSGTLQDSREGADYRVAEGIQSVLNLLSPGANLTLSFGDWPSSDVARLAGYDVTFDYGNGTLVLPVRWALPDFTLFPGLGYQVWLVNDKVRVTEIG